MAYSELSKLDRLSPTQYYLVFHNHYEIFKDTTQEFDDSLFDTAWLIIVSARKKGIFPSPKVYEKICMAYESEAPIAPSHRIDS